MEREIIDCTLVLYRDGEQCVNTNGVSPTTIDSPLPIYRIVEIVPGD